MELKPGPSTTKITIVTFGSKPLSKLISYLFIRVQIKNVGKSINKVINRYIFGKWTLKDRSIYKKGSVDNLTNRPNNTL